MRNKMLEHPNSGYPTGVHDPGPLRGPLSVAPAALCTHSAGGTFVTESGLVLRWCSRRGCGALGVKRVGEKKFCWAQPSERGEEMLEGIVEKARGRKNGKRRR